VKRAFGWVLLILGAGGVVSVLRALGEASTDYDRTAAFFEAVVVAALLFFGWRLARRPAKLDARRRSEPPGG